MMGVYRVRNDTCAENPIEKVRRVKNRKKRKVLKTCLYCMHYRKGCGCVVQPCPYAEDHIQRNCYTAKDTYRIFVEGVMIPTKNVQLDKRIQTLIHSFCGKMYLDNFHKWRYYSAVQKVKRHCGRITSGYLAALYLLTADKKLWRFATGSVYINEVDFVAMKVQYLSEDSYAYYIAAKELHMGERLIKQSELADQTVVSDQAFELIVHARLIKAYGDIVLKLEGKEC